MIRKLFSRGLRIGAVVGAILVLVQLVLRRQPAPQPGADDPRPASPPRPSPTPAAHRNGAAAPAATTATKSKTASKTASKRTAATIKAWVEPVDGACPTDYPVKAKVASGIFHVPGGMAYDRTTPDRCYQDAAAAEADGYRPAKR